MNTGNVTSATAARNLESARRGDGKFGEQHRGEADLDVTGLQPAPAEDLTGLSPLDIDNRMADIQRRANDLSSRLKELRKWSQPKYLQAYSVGFIEGKAKAADLVDVKLQDTLAEQMPLNEEYERRGRWARYFIVDHLHTSQYCPSFRPSTRIGWLPQYSGKSTDDMIEQAGSMVCTKCVPDAPVNGKRPTLPELAEEWDKQNANDFCPGSGQLMYASLPNRIGYYSGNWATCHVCGGKPAPTSTGKLRKHKAPAK